MEEGKSFTITGEKIHKMFEAAGGFFTAAVPAMEEFAYACKGVAQLSVTALEIVQDPRLKSGIKEALIMWTRDSKSRLDRERNRREREKPLKPYQQEGQQRRERIQQRHSEIVAGPQAGVEEELKKGTNQAQVAPVQRREPKKGLTHHMQLPKMEPQEKDENSVATPA
jgi:hypothetical protein